MLCAVITARERMAERSMGGLAGTCLALVLAIACGSEDEQARQAARAEVADSLEAGDANAALQAARRALNTGGEDADMLLLAGTAALELKRYSEALEFAERGLALASGLDQTADLRWLQGKALMARFHEVHDENDWRRANVALEPAVSAGSHRTDAAMLLVLLQDMSQLGDAERQLRFARELLSSAPGTVEAAKVRAYLERRGIQP
jgi:tetratricopeptide (TPR) repeat protein